MLNVNGSFGGPGGLGGLFPGESGSSGDLFPDSSSGGSLSSGGNLGSSIGSGWSSGVAGLVGIGCEDGGLTLSNDSVPDVCSFGVIWECCATRSVCRLRTC